MGVYVAGRICRRIGIRISRIFERANERAQAASCDRRVSGRNAYIRRCNQGGKTAIPGTTELGDGNRQKLFEYLRESIPASCPLDTSSPSSSPTPHHHRRRPRRPLILSSSCCCCRCCRPCCRCRPPCSSPPSSPASPYSHSHASIFLLVSPLVFPRIPRSSPPACPLTRCPLADVALQPRPQTLALHHFLPPQPARALLSC